MLNYIHAEIYKACHRRYLYGLTGVLLLLVRLYAAIWVGVASFANMVGLLSGSMLAGLYLTPLLTEVVFSDQHRQHTLKNEVSFGIPRTRLYLGKLFASLMVALAVCALVFVCYLGIAWLVCSHLDAAEEQAALAILGYVLLASLPLWIGMLGASVMLFFLLPNGTLAGTILMAGIFIGDLMSVLLLSIQSAPVNAAGLFLQRILLTSHFGQYHGALGLHLMVKNWLLGLGWLAMSTAIGLTVFRRREIP